MLSGELKGLWIARNGLAKTPTFWCVLKAVGTPREGVGGAVFEGICDGLTHNRRTK